jgi:hypothetical protein
MQVAHACRAEFKHVTLVVYHHLAKRFSGGPEIARWGRLQEDGSVMEDEHVAVKVRDASSGNVVTLHVPAGKMPLGMFRDSAGRALKLDAANFALCEDGRDDVINLDEHAEKQKERSVPDRVLTLFDVGWMVRLKRH